MMALMAMVVKYSSNSTVEMNNLVTLVTKFNDWGNDTMLTIIY